MSTGARHKRASMRCSPPGPATHATHGQHEDKREIGLSAFPLVVEVPPDGHADKHVVSRASLWLRAYARAR